MTRTIAPTAAASAPAMTRPGHRFALGFGGAGCALALAGVGLDGAAAGLAAGAGISLLAVAAVMPMIARKAADAPLRAAARMLRAARSDLDVKPAWLSKDGPEGELAAATADLIEMRILTAAFEAEMARASTFAASLDAVQAKAAAAAEVMRRESDTVARTTGTLTRTLEDSGQRLAVRVSELQELSHAGNQLISRAVHEIGDQARDLLAATHAVQARSHLIEDEMTRFDAAVQAVSGKLDASRDRLGVLTGAIEHAVTQQREQLAVLATSQPGAGAMVPDRGDELLDAMRGLDVKLDRIEAVIDRHDDRLEQAVARIEAAPAEIRAAADGAFAAMPQWAARFEEAAVAFGEAARRLASVERPSEDRSTEALARAVAAATAGAMATDIAELRGAVAALADRPATEPGIDATIAQSLDGLSDAIAQIAAKVQDLATRPPEQAATAALPPFDAERAQVQHLLEGFRLIMRKLASQAAELGTVVTAATSAVAQASLYQPVAGEAIASAIARQESRIDEISEAIRQLAAATERQLVPRAGSTDEGAARNLPSFEPEKVRFNQIFTGFSLLMRELGRESERLRATVDGAADGVVRIAAAETALTAAHGALATLTHRLEAQLAAGERAAPASEAADFRAPIEALQRAVEDSVAGLRAAQAAMSARETPPASARPATQVPSVEAAIALMDGISGDIEGRFSELDRKIDDLRNGLSGTDGALEVSNGLADAARSLRVQTAEFLAISAALSAELGRQAEGAPTSPQRGSNLARGRGRAA